MIITNIEKRDKKVVIYTQLPQIDAGLSKNEILDKFILEMRSFLDEFAQEALGGEIYFNGRMTVEMALAAGVIAMRLGAKAIYLYDLSTGEYVQVAGGSRLEMPTQVLPGMVVEIDSDQSMFKKGARAVVLNVGKGSVNIGHDRPANQRYGRRDTGWTSIYNVRPIDWEEIPVI